MSDSFKSIARFCDKRISFFSVNKLGRFVRVLKDPLPAHEHCDVVYKISYKDCDASYVGQTSRLLKIRVAEHRCHINRNTIQHSMITDHRINYNHNFDWDGARVLDSEPFRFRREISEMIHIKLQANGIRKSFRATRKLFAAHIWTLSICYRA